MDLRHSAWADPVRKYACKVLKRYIIPENDTSYLYLNHPCRTPRELRPAWTRPVLGLTLPKFLRQFEQAFHDEDCDAPITIPTTTTSNDDSQPTTNQDNSGPQE